MDVPPDFVKMKTFGHGTHSNECIPCPMHTFMAACQSGALNMNSASQKPAPAGAFVPADSPDSDYLLFTGALPAFLPPIASVFFKTSAEWA
jgi:hypothetical protein